MLDRPHRVIASRPPFFEFSHSVPSHTSPSAKVGPLQLYPSPTTAPPTGPLQPYPSPTRLPPTGPLQPYPSPTRLPPAGPLQPYPSPTRLPPTGQHQYQSNPDSRSPPARRIIPVTKKVKKTNLPAPGLQCTGVHNPDHPHLSTYTIKAVQRDTLTHSTEKGNRECVQLKACGGHTP